MCLDFYTANWETIRADLLVIEPYVPTKIHLPRQKHRVIICLPTDIKDHTPDGYLPISLLNTEYKILARIMASHLRPILAEQLEDSQFCGVPATQSWMQSAQSAMFSPIPRQRERLCAS